MAGIILVRHASTAWTGRRYCGRSDPPLSAPGRAEAAQLAGDLAPTLTPGTRIVTSPSRRSHATAAAIAAAAGIAEVTLDDRWREADFGGAEGLTFDELARVAPDIARRLAAGQTEIDWPDGERATEMAARVAEAWHDLVEAGAGVVVVSHAGPLRLAIGLATGRTPEAVDLPAPGAVVRLPSTVPG
jgi:ribonuclease H / adenosylcobalamin/alpha-ribazole phosphatase